MPLQPCQAAEHADGGSWSLPPRPLLLLLPAGSNCEDAVAAAVQAAGMAAALAEPEGCGDNFTPAGRSVQSSHKRACEGQRDADDAAAARADEARRRARAAARRWRAALLERLR